MKVVILATADFDAPIWTNKQQMASRLSEHADVLYINSLGLRQPRLNKKDFFRILRKIRSVLFSQKSSSDSNPRVVQPWLFPFHSNKLLRGINRILFRLQIQIALRRWDFGGSTLWTFSPTTYGIESLFDGLVYHSVDLLHAFPGVNREALLADEKSLVSKADRVIASSEGVKAHLIKSTNADVALWENVADTKLFGSFAKAHRIKQVVYFGNLTDAKIDAGLLIELAQSGIRLFIAGPRGIDGTQGNWVSELSEFPNTTVQGPVSQKEMAEVCGSSRVGIIPYKCDEHTDGVFPLKLYEYLSSGMSVVSTPLRSLQGRQIDGLKISKPENFVSAVKELLETPFLGDHKDISRYVENSWEYRVSQMLSVCESLEASKTLPGQDKKEVGSE